MPIDEELKGVIGESHFGVGCSAGDLESNGNLYISSGFLVGLPVIVHHALKAHHKKVGDRVEVVLGFDDLSAQLDLKAPNS